jgi:hypothetical protein
MLTYSRPDPHVNGKNGRFVNGRGLAHRKLDRDGRADLAADLVTGVAEFKPSLAQVCQLLGVPQLLVRDVLKARFHSKVEISTGSAADEIVSAWKNASDAVREDALRRIGPAAVWDRLAEVVK